MASRFVYGLHPVQETLRRHGRQVQGLIVSKQKLLLPILTEAERLEIPVQSSSVQELELLCGASSHQGVVAIVGEFPYLELEDLLQRSAGPPLLIVLDSVTDPQNLGAIIRSALVLGATGVILPKDRAAPVTPTVVRVSAGASEHLPCARVTNLSRSLERLKEAGFWIAGAVERGGIAPDEMDMRGPTALVLGSEQKGIRPLVLHTCDLRLTIPTRSAIAALNVAAAATALLYEAARQRRS